jgi:ankyrin repeat protein
MKKKTFYIRNTILLAILIPFLYTSNLFAQNKGINVMEGVAENKLISAILYKDIAEVEKVLTEGVDINQQDGNGYTSLIWACSFSSDENYREKAKLLISKSSDVKIQANDGNAAIIEAAGNSREIFDMLLDKGAEINVKKEDGTGAYYNCMVHMLLYGKEITDKDIELAQLLLANGANVDEAPVSGDLQGFTPLIFAARGNKIDVVNFLIENGANVNAKNVNDETPLSLAEEAGNTEIVKILKAKGATN